MLYHKDWLALPKVKYLQFTLLLIRNLPSGQRLILYETLVKEFNSPHSASEMVCQGGSSLVQDILEQNDNPDGRIACLAALRDACFNQLVYKVGIVELFK